MFNTNAQSSIFDADEDLCHNLWNLLTLSGQWVLKTILVIGLQKSLSSWRSHEIICTQVAVQIYLNRTSDFVFVLPICSYIYLAGLNNDCFNRIMYTGCNVQHQINFLNKIKKPSYFNIGQVTIHFTAGR